MVATVWTVNLEDSTQMANLKKKDALAKDSTQKWMKDEYVPVTSFIHTYVLITIVVSIKPTTLRRISMHRTILTMVVQRMILSMTRQSTGH